MFMPSDQELITAINPPFKIECNVGSYYIKRVLVDCGPGLNVVSYDAFFNLYYIDDNM